MTERVRVTMSVAATIHAVLHRYAASRRRAQRSLLNHLVGPSK